MSKIGVSDKVIRVLAMLYTKATMAIKSQYDTSNPINVTKGVLQGEIFSPTLFALFISDLEEFLISKGIRGVSVSSLTEILLLAYADDIVIVADSIAMMRRILKALKKYCEINCLSEK